MAIRLNQKQEDETCDALADSGTLELVIARVKFFISTTPDRKLAKRYAALLQSLEKLQIVLSFIALKQQDAIAKEQYPFLEGIPRWVLQVESQFKSYVIPPNLFQSDWAKKRLYLWECFESSIPSSIRDVLLSWRWKAELSAFRQMKDQLEESQKKISLIGEQIEREENALAKGRSSLSVWGRIRILRWSKQAKENELIQAQLEREKLQKSKELVALLRECEDLAAFVALDMKTTVVDCGDYFSTVFEECSRSIDNEIKKELSVFFAEKMRERDALKQRFESLLKNQEKYEKEKINQNESLTRSLEGRIEKDIDDAQNLLQKEFFYLNSFEIEKQENARHRWNRAVENMVKIMKSTEEKLLYGRRFN